MKDTDNPLIKLTETQLKIGSRRCIDNAKKPLESALLLIDHTFSEQYALGLYFYAIEEFGKAKILEKYEKEKIYQIPLWLIGIGNPNKKSIEEDRILRELLKDILDVLDNPTKRITSHNVKLFMGFNNLPPYFRVIWRGIKVHTHFPSNKEFKINNYNKLSISAYNTGTFSSFSTNDTNAKKIDWIFVDFDLKTACFYADWDDNNQSWNYDIAIDSEKLKTIYFILRISYMTSKGI